MKIAAKSEDIPFAAATTKMKIKVKPKQKLIKMHEWSSYTGLMPGLWWNLPNMHQNIRIRRMRYIFVQLTNNSIENVIIRWIAEV